MTASSGPRMAGSLVLALALAACTAGGPAGSAGSSPPGAFPIASGPPAPSAPTPVPVPSAPGAVDGGAGGGSGPNPGSGGLVPVNPGGPPVVQPEPTLVQPITGLLSIHPVGAVELVPTVDGRHVTVRIAWWSGVAPCSVLAGVDVARDGRTFTLTVREGAARLDVACIEIAMYKATLVDLGELDPGEYTIAAYGEVAPVTVTVAG